MNGFRQMLVRFMYGRYGADQLTKLYLGAAAACLIVYSFIRLPFIYLIGILLMAYSMYRSFSKNITKMSSQNQRYLKWRYQQAAKCSSAKQCRAQRKEFRIYKCPGCKQKVRVPRGRGKIAITCPKCRTEFIKKS